MTDNYQRERDEVNAAMDRAQRKFAVEALGWLLYDLTKGYAKDAGATTEVLTAIEDAMDNIQPLH